MPRATAGRGSGWASAAGSSSRPAEAAGVLTRRAADHRFEILDEVRLIEVAEIERQPREIDRVAVGHALDRLVQPVPHDHPLRADADVKAEQPLDLALADAQIAARERVDHLIDLGDLPILDDAG